MNTRFVRSILPFFASLLPYSIIDDSCIRQPTYSLTQPNHKKRKEKLERLYIVVAGKARKAIQ